MRGLALDYADQGIRANCVIPGATDTRLIHQYFESTPDPEEARRKLLDSIPMRRLASPGCSAGCSVSRVRLLVVRNRNLLSGGWRFDGTGLTGIENEGRNAAIQWDYAGDGNDVSGG